MKVAGQVRVHRGERTILKLGPGKRVGQLAVLDAEPRSASVTAVEDTRLLRIDRNAFDKVMADRPAIARGVIQTLCQRLCMTTAARPA